MTILRPKSNTPDYIRMHLSGITPTRLSPLTAEEIAQLEIRVDEQPSAAG
jgi:hypothetical protein